MISTVASLDRETRAEYSLLIEARDLGTPVQQATRHTDNTYLATPTTMRCFIYSYSCSEDAPQTKIHLREKKINSYSK